MVEDGLRCNYDGELMKRRKVPPLVEAEHLLQTLIIIQRTLRESTATKHGASPPTFLALEPGLPRGILLCNACAMTRLFRASDSYVYHNVDGCERVWNRREDIYNKSRV